MKTLSAFIPGTEAPDDITLQHLITSATTLNAAIYTTDAKTRDELKKVFANFCRRNNIKWDRLTMEERDVIENLENDRAALSK